MPSKKDKSILWFSEISIRDLLLVGGKNSSLGEMYSKLKSEGVPVPGGFAVTAGAYRHFLEYNDIARKIEKILAGLNKKTLRNLAEKGYKVRQTILSGSFPKSLETEIIKAYKRLGNGRRGDVSVAVRSSATAEDLPSASFAGQLESYLNIRGPYQLLDAVKKCMASLFTDRAISYRIDQGFDIFKVYVSVGVQKMVRSDKAVSGVMFSIDTESGFKDAVLINASYGLGEAIVKGQVNPDEFYVFKPLLAKGFKPIIGSTRGAKRQKIVYDTSSSARTTKTVAVPQEDRLDFCLTESEVLKLARWGTIIEKHYKKPMDIEWAKDGVENKLYIVQARPETVHAKAAGNILTTYSLKKKGRIICEGPSVGNKIGQGTARIIKDATKINQFKAGEVLVTEMTDPDWEPIMKKASAIITNSGGRTSHAAIVSRELGLPAIVGTKIGTKAIKSGQKVTVSCAEGEIGKVYAGLLPFRVRKTNLAKVRKPPVDIMLNIADPEQAFNFSFIPQSGVGLAREEFIISSYIGIHPQALIDFAKIKDPELRGKIEEKTIGFPNKTAFFVNKLAEGIGRLAAAFYPKDVIVRTSDFKTNEYATLLGGEAYEPDEANPMIGWRGASRYYSKEFSRSFGLECQAIKKAREYMGLDNIKVMIPFCRTVEEGKQVLKIMRQNGLKRGVKKLEVYVMAEIPSNIILAKEFSKIFDGFSIGSNDLTQLALGVDRDNEWVAHVYNERNQAVKDLIKNLIETAHKNKTKVGICGQAPSDFPDFAEFLIKAGIDSISLNPDTVLPTMVRLARQK